MFQHLLVPLDGSRMAEAALPVAVSMARSFASRVTLFHAIEKDAPREIHGERHLGRPDDARDYLSAVASRAFPVDICVDTHVHEGPEGNVPISIVDHVRDLKVDMVVMCTHGRGGLRAFMFGPIAQQAAALGTVPVVFVQPSEAEGDWEFDCRRIIVPLDGNGEHEQGLHVAENVGRVYGAELHLVMVVHTVRTLPGENAATARMLPRTAAALLELARQDAVEYLGSHVRRLESVGIRVTSAVLRGDPVTALADTVESVKADLIVLGTHGKTGLEAFWSRSATPRLSRKIRIPFLLVPVHGKNLQSR
jgi:nucleotide-binding universal stress UspA family protein